MNRDLYKGVPDPKDHVNETLLKLWYQNQQLVDRPSSTTLYYTTAPTILTEAGGVVYVTGSTDFYYTLPTLRNGAIIPLFVEFAADTTAAIYVIDEAENTVASILAPESGRHYRLEIIASHDAWISTQVYSA